MCAINTAIRIRSVGMAQGSYVDEVEIFRIDDDPANLPRVLEANMFPGLAAIGRFVHPVAELDRVAHVGFARADVNDVWILRRNRNRAEGCGVSRIKNRRPGAARIYRLPNAAAN